MGGEEPDRAADPPDAEATREELPGEHLAASVLPAVYAQLRAAAHKQLSDERGGHTLSATALVHEAYLKLASGREVPWEGRRHFYAAAAEAMRQVLLDHARARARVKRGGGRARIDLDQAPTVQEPGAAGGRAGSLDPDDFVALDGAIRRLGDRDPRMAEVVRLKYYAGLEIAQVAAVLGVSERTVKNDWAFARAWLEREMRG